MLRRVAHLSIASTVLVVGIGCNQILGIEQGHYPDGGPVTNGAPDAGTLGGEPSLDAGKSRPPPELDAGGAGGSRSDMDANGCEFPIAGNYEETDTAYRDTCNESTGSSTATVVVTRTSTGAVLSINGTALPSCPAQISGCDLHWECSNQSTGLTLVSDLTFDAGGFSGTLEETSSDGCSVLSHSTGSRR